MYRTDGQGASRRFVSACDVYTKLPSVWSRDPGGGNNMRMRLVAPSLAIILGRFLASMGLATDGKQTLDTGKRLYEEHCGVCHGLLGDGQGMAAHMFQTPPRDFREGKDKFRSTPPGSRALGGDPCRSVESGGRGSRASAGGPGPCGTSPRASRNGHSRAVRRLKSCIGA